jgi:hypothetical protein
LLLVEQAGPDLLFDHLMSDVVGDIVATAIARRALGVFGTYCSLKHAGSRVRRSRRMRGPAKRNQRSRRCTQLAGNRLVGLGNGAAGPDDRHGVHIGGDVLGRRREPAVAAESVRPR